MHLFIVMLYLLGLQKELFIGITVFIVHGSLAGKSLINDLTIVLKIQINNV